MKIVISADMEGTCGVVNWVQVTPPEQAGAGRSASTAEYERARLRMTHEVNAAIEGAIQAGAEQVIVNDSHDGMRNILIDELHPSAQLISGFNKTLLMAQGVEQDDVSAIFYTGYHARAGTPDGPLAHSFTGWIHDIRVDGTSLGEYGVNALIAGHYRVPVAFVSGDNRAVEQTRQLLGSDVVGVPTKTGLSTTSAQNFHPEQVNQAIRAGAAEAVNRIEKLQPYRLAEDAVIEIDLDHQARVDQVEPISGIERSGWRSFKFQPADGLELNRMIRAAITAASQMPG